MKLIIAGSRGIPMTGDGFFEVDSAIREAGYYSDIDIAPDGEIPAWGKVEVTEVVGGGAAGADSLGEDWAAVNWVPVKRFLPDWETHGKAAGHIRNRQMGDYADALVAVWDGKSPGTKGMIDYMKSLGKPVYVHRV